MNTKTQAECLDDLSEDDYAALPFLSASKIRSAIKHNHEEAIKVFSQKKFDHPNSLGKWLHYFLLEKPNASPDDDPDCPTYLHEDIKKAQKALEENSDMKQILSTSKVEQSFLWYDDLIEASAKARLDILSEDRIWDLKCLKGGSDKSSFEKRMRRMAWHIQAWWYQRAVDKVFDKNLPVGFIVLDTIHWKFHFHELNKDELMKASNQAREAIRKLKRWGLL